MKKNEREIVLSPLCEQLKPYAAGEQPSSQEQYIKLNTNEAAYPPSLAVKKAVVRYDCDALKLYPSPENTMLKSALSKYYGFDENQIFVGNGSDEILTFCIPAFVANGKVAYADVTYSFYPSVCSLFSAQSVIVPLDDTFNIKAEDYAAIDANAIIIANPNAPTSIAAPMAVIKQILDTNPDKMVIVDEAYADFSNDSAMRFVKKYSNLLVVRTFSKSFALAGIRLGYAFGHPNAIEALNRVKNCFNSYTVNRLTEAAGIAALSDRDYYENNISRLKEVREYFIQEIRNMGFDCPDSATNFIFAKFQTIDGKDLYLKLKERGFLVRHFNSPRINDYIRISVGTFHEMSLLLGALEEIIQQ